MPRVKGRDPQGAGRGRWPRRSPRQILPTPPFAAEAGKKREQGDTTTLQAAKTYTDTSVAAEAEERTQGDTTTLSSAKTYPDTSRGGRDRSVGRAMPRQHQSANSHADADRGFGIRP